MPREGKVVSLRTNWSLPSEYHQMARSRSSEVGDSTRSLALNVALQVRRVQMLLEVSVRVRTAKRQVPVDKHILALLQRVAPELDDSVRDNNSLKVHRGNLARERWPPGQGPSLTLSYELRGLTQALHQIRLARADANTAY